jgi:nicotinate-nucleotide adenylyltransferase
MTDKNINLGILGGSFDPVHIGHLIIAQTALYQFNLDKVIFIPSGKPSHRHLPIADSSDRFKMVELAIEDNPDFEISDMEIKNNAVSYTYDTILEIKKNFSEADIFFILGSDAFDIIEKWKNINLLSREVVFLVASRDKKKEIKHSPDIKNFFIDNFCIEISSSSIRNLCKDKKSIKYLVPEKVREYIERKHLYE